MPKGFIPTLPGIRQAWDDYYVTPLRFKVVIKSADGLDTLHTFDSFASSNDIAVQKIDVTRGMDQYPSFEMQINDNPNDKMIDRDLVDNGCIVIISVGKTQEEYQNLFWGKIDNFKERTEQNSDLTYIVNGLGLAKIADHTIINLIKTAPPESLRDGTKTWTDTPAFHANNLVKQILTDKQIIPTPGKKTVQSRMGCSLNGIADELDTFLPSINNPLVYASEALNNVLDAAGGIWYIDENNDFKAYFPNVDLSGHIIKDYLDPGDSGDFVSYRLKDWEIEGSTDPSSGFANFLIAIAEQAKVVSGQAKALSYTSLWNKDLAQLVISTSAVFRDLTMILSKVGAGTDAPDPNIATLDGMIVLDKYPENIQTGYHYPASGQENILATFSTPIKDISENPEPISKINLSYKRPPSSIPINKPAWLILLERGNSENNSVRWWHDDNFDNLGAWSAQRPLPLGRSEGDTFSNTGWLTNKRGPSFTHGYVTTSRVPVIAYDPDSIARWTPGRPVEVRISAPWIRYARTMQDYLDQLIQITAKKPLTFNTNIVTNSNIIPKPGQEMQIVERRLGYSEGLDFLATLMEDHYFVDATDDSGSAVGTLYHEVTVKSYMSPFSFYGKSSV
jgi:hypothetical protein